jgi:ATP-dependent exoDNAse (exonuclease V) alpha subunit
LLPTRDAVEVLRRAAGGGARVVLVGDTRQHPAVEAGAPFRVLQDHGMPTALLARIRRQDPALVPELHAAVAAASRGETAEAVRRLAAMGSVLEIRDEARRLGALAADYVADPEGTLLLAPSNRERGLLNALVRDELRRGGRLAAGEVDVSTLRARDTTAAERALAATYRPGDVVLFRRGRPAAGIAAGTYADIVDAHATANRVVVELPGGERRAFDARRLRGVTLYAPEGRAFAVGERVQFTAPARLAGVRVPNGAFATLEHVDPDGTARLRLDSGRALTVDLGAARHLDYGYAVTSYKSQGHTCRRALLAINAEDSKLLVNQAQTYVSLSRARLESKIYTSDAAALPGAVSRRAEKAAALDYAAGPVAERGP